MITLTDVCKSYRVAKRQAGLTSALRAFFLREYETVRALSDVSFHIGEGEMVGYIGPNGAGKSTTVKILCGVLTPDSGSCLVNGRVPWKERIPHTREIGVVFGQRSQLWWDVPIADSFELLRGIYKIDGARYAKNLKTLTELLDLGEILKTPARSVSLGQRMRCEIAASLLHDPRILFLDEPTIGLDAISKIAVRDFIRNMNQERGITVILTSHDMQDVEALANRVMLIGKGRILIDGRMEDLKKRASARKTLDISYRGARPDIAPGMTPVHERAGHMRLSLDPAALPVSEAIAYLAAHAELTDVSVSDISAEEMALALYREYKL